VELIKELISYGLVKKAVDFKSSLSYKFLIDIDGYSNAWSGFYTKLLTGSLIFKILSQNNFKQWYYDRLKPWVHFIPIKHDFSDLNEKVQWALSNDDKAKRIAENSQKFAFNLNLENELNNSLATIQASINYVSNQNFRLYN
jgi:hypothetical protein